MNPNVFKPNLSQVVHPIVTRRMMKSISS